MDNIDILLYVIPLEPSIEKFKQLLNEYQEIIDSEWFTKTSIIVVFTKEDLLTENKEETIKKYIYNCIDKYKDTRFIYHCLGSSYSKELIEKIMKILKILGIATTKKMFDK